MSKNETNDLPITDVDALYDDVYAELRRVAKKQMQKVWSVGTISTTALVNESYLKLAKLQSVQFENKAHFFAVAATAMRQILINYAEQKGAQKRGGDWLKVTYQEPLHESEMEVKTLLAVNDALDEIREIDADLAQLVELRFFAGMTESEIAEVFQVNERTVRRNWKKAKMLLKHALETAD